MVFYKGKLVNTWIFSLLMLCGDVERNPGPNVTATSASGRDTIVTEDMVLTFLDTHFESNDDGAKVSGTDLFAFYCEHNLNHSLSLQKFLHFSGKLKIGHRKVRGKKMFFVQPKTTVAQSFLGDKMSAKLSDANGCAINTFMAGQRNQIFLGSFSNFNIINFGSDVALPLNKAEKCFEAAMVSRR